MNIQLSRTTVDTADLAIDIYLTPPLLSDRGGVSQTELRQFGAMLEAAIRERYTGAVVAIHYGDNLRVRKVDLGARDDATVARDVDNELDEIWWDTVEAFWNAPAA